MTKEEFINKWDTDSDYANGSKEMKKDLALLEQRLLLSSEAEKGEYDWEKFNDDCWNAVGGRFLQRDLDKIKQMWTPPQPIPLTTKGEQNSAPKEDGVEAKSEVEKMIDEGLKSGKYISLPGMDLNGKRLNLIIVNPSAPDKVEWRNPESIQETYANAGIDISSVGKSEGEEAKTIENYVFEALGAASMCWIPAPSTQEFDSSAAKVIGDLLMERIKEYAHSSGDRGRKEWPVDAQIDTNKK